MHTKHYKTLMKETEEKDNWRDTSYEQLEIVTLSGWELLLDSSTKSMHSYQNSSRLFIRKCKIDSKMYLEMQKTQNNQHNFKKKENCKPYQATAIWTVVRQTGNAG